ncbi:RHS repeat domain-containing protein [Fusicatenibacter saccharivorans]|uniref:RHS repeat domain-containing protein n=1 Tax=Fusicatenibacter saccharivorans TaxID=1150298 RepID=UPI003D05BF51
MCGSGYFYQKNLQGDIIGLIDSTGTEVVTYTYDTWGKLLSKTDGSGNGLAEKNPFRYRGYYYDAEVSLYYLNGRYYDPEVRRMLSPDTIEVLTVGIDFLGKNLYIYCDNNPVLRKDDEGEFWHVVAAGAISAVLEMGTTIAVNLIAGNDWYDGLAVAAFTGFVSGSVQTLGLGPVQQKAVDVTLAVANTVVAGMHDKDWESEKRNCVQLRREISDSRASSRNYRQSVKAGGKKSVLARKKIKMNNNRKRFIKDQLKRNIGIDRAFTSGINGVVNRFKRSINSIVKWVYARLK